MSTAIGINFGTTSSCVGIFHHNCVDIIRDSMDSPITPSYVAFTNEERLVGDTASISMEKTELSRRDAPHQRILGWNPLALLIDHYGPRDLRMASIASGHIFLCGMQIF
jgi:hypothetical protein